MKQELKFLLLLILLHIPLGVALYNIGALGLLHPLIVFLLGMRYAVIKEEPLERVALACAYLVGAEVLWRMASIPIFWEFGKYGTSFIMVTALFRRGFMNLPMFAVFYFILLLPAGFQTITDNNFSEARAILSTILSGPFFLLISCWFFSNLPLSLEQLKKLFLALIMPLLSIAVVTLFFTVTTPDIQFTGESNFATSGGFGPNQVSSMLGLGAFLCIAGFLLFKNAFNYILLFGVLAILFTSQSVLTFSRSGMYNAIGGILLIIIFQIRNLKDGVKKILPILAISAVFLFFVFPYLDDFTGGALQQRFEDKDPTKRGDILDTDFKIFLDNPVFGIGIGKAYDERAKYLEYKAMTHTEFGRVIAEHGVFGLLSMVAMGLMVIFNFRKQKILAGKAMVAGFIGWSFLFMLNTGMRLAAPAFIWGMCYILLIDYQNRKSLPNLAKNNSDEQLFEK